MVVDGCGRVVVLVVVVVVSACARQVLGAGGKQAGRQADHYYRPPYVVKPMLINYDVGPAVKKHMVALNLVALHWPPPRNPPKPMGPALTSDKASVMLLFTASWRASSSPSPRVHTCCAAAKGHPGLFTTGVYTPKNIPAKPSH